MKKIYKPFKKLSILLLFSAMGFYAHAQTEEAVLKGKLIDELNNEPLVGVTVFIKGTKEAVQTDENGAFELKTKRAFPFTLSVAYVGYQSKDIEIYEEDQNIEFKLRSQRALSEVVVVGYGEQKREDLTGSVSSIPPQLKAQPIVSPERLLQGAIPGAIVTQTSGQPGAGVSVQIRGNNSITAASDPLYVIDGFPINNDYDIVDAGVTDRNGVRLNPLSSISPSDIESIDVLKDASATAIYGSRGANGVVIITTKKGSADKSSINYDGYYGVQNVIKTIPVLNAREWWQLRKDAAANTPNAKNPITSLPAPTGWKYDTTGEGTDWQKAAFTEAPIQNHNISILSGNEKTRLAFSGNYFNQEGVLINTGFKRYSGRINIDHDFNERLKVTSYVTASQTEAKVAPQAIVPNLLFSSPAIPIYDTLGNFVKNTSTDSPYQNPINSLKNQINESATTRLLANTSLDYKIATGLSAKVLVGTDIVQNKQNRYLPNSTYEGNPSGVVGNGGIATIGNVNTYNWLNENTLNYSRTFNKKHNINAVGGFTAQASDTKGFSASSATFANDELTYNALQNGTGLRPSSSFATSWQLASFLARINYVLNERYLFTFTIRADGSSRFGPNRKWGYFPSAAVGWNLHKENFMKQVPLISQLKLRLSAGNTGNQGIVPYSSIGLMAPYRYNFSNTNVQGYAPNSVNNVGLGWENTFQVNAGIDLGIYKNRISIIADYYYKRTTDLLLNAPVPGTSGLSFYDPNTNLSQSSTVYQNIGEVENKGFELGINTQNIETKKFTWGTTFIFSQNQNKILSLGSGVDRIIPNINLPSVLQVGAPVGSFLVYETDGVIQPGEDGANALTPQGNRSVGGQKYVDQNGDGRITQLGDRVVIHNQPGVNLGLTNTFNYNTPFGSFDLTVFFQSVLGGKLYNQNRAQLELNTGYNNGTKDMVNAYRAPGTRGPDDPGNTNTDIKEAYQDPAITISNRFIEDASYVRLKNVTLGYTLPNAWLSKARIKNLRFYASLQNFVTWTNYTGFDPEASQQNQSLIFRGIDNGVYPNSKAALAGVNLSF